MAKNILSEKINTKCGGKKGDAKKKCVSVVRDQHNRAAEREQEYADYDREMHEYDRKVKKYGGGEILKAIEHIEDKKQVLEDALELRKMKKGKWDVKGRERTLEDVMFDEELDANFYRKMRMKKYRERNFPHLQSKKK